WGPVVARRQGSRDRGRERRRWTVHGLVLRFLGRTGLARRRLRLRARRSELLGGAADPGPGVRTGRRGQCAPVLERGRWLDGRVRQRTRHSLRGRPPGQGPAAAAARGGGGD